MNPYIYIYRHYTLTPRESISKTIPCTFIFTTPNSIYTDIHYSLHLSKNSISNPYHALSSNLYQTL